LGKLKSRQQVVAVSLISVAVTLEISEVSYPLNFPVAASPLLTNTQIVVALNPTLDPNSDPPSI